MSKEKFDLKGYEKYWATNISFLTCSYFGFDYTKFMPENFGIGFKNAVFFSDNGYSSCYLKTKERGKYSKYVIKKFAKDKKSVEEFCALLKGKADYLQKFIDDSLIKEKAGKEEFVKLMELFNNYNGYHISPRHIVDYISPDFLQAYLPDLEAARVYVEKVHVKIESFLNKFAENIAENSGYDKNLVLRLTRKEIEEYFESKVLPDKKNLEDREFAMLFFEAGKEIVVAGGITKEFEAEINKADVSSASELKGAVAFPGKAKGVVRIIFKPAEAKVFNDGDILVTPMTRPDFVPLMQKAGAIITDAGGVLCHAAITAREIKKPCIIGTKVATQVLKDGDEVEVDADKGVVKILNKK